jgi:hypothetical protein
MPELLYSTVAATPAPEDSTGQLSPTCAGGVGGKGAGNPVLKICLQLGTIDDN